MAENKYDIKAQVVFVEDEPAIREFMVMTAQNMGLTCVDFENPIEALKYNNWEGVFLIVSDHAMPEKTGVEFCEELRSKAIDIPFVLLTAFADKSVAVRGLNAKVNEIVEKPIDFDGFKEILNKYKAIWDKKQAEKDDEFAELIEFFIDETKELYKDLEETILKLAEEPIDPQVVDLIFRKVHSVKGGASAIPQAELLAKLSHEFESRLSFLKNERYTPPKEEIQLYQDAADLSLKLIDSMKKTSDKKPVYYKDRIFNMIEQIKNLPKVSGQTGEAPGLVDAQLSPEAKGQAVDAESFQEEEIMVKNSQLDQFMQIAGEFVILKNYFQALLQDIGDGSQVEFAKILSRLENFSRSTEKSTQSLQVHILEVRKVSLKKITSKLQRICRQASKSLNKKIDIIIEGADLKVDKSIATAIGASLTHMVRNSIDHGIEHPMDRINAGKAETGNIVINFIEKKEAIHVEIIDDGRGLNIPKIKSKALEKRLISESQSQTMPDTDIAQLIFLPGFSTADKITDVSGRGVGMDAALNMVNQLNGNIKIESTGAKGTTFYIDIPFLQTISVERSLIVMADSMYMALPIDNVRQILKGGDLQVCDMNDHLVLIQKDKNIPLLGFNQKDGVHKQLTREQVHSNLVVTLCAGRRNFALVVDKVLQQTEAVTQPLPDAVVKEEYVEGTTIIGDDRVAYVIDPELMINSVLPKEELISETTQKTPTAPAPTAAAA